MKNNISYKVDGSTFSFNYDDYHDFYCKVLTEDIYYFYDNLVPILHLTCVVQFLFGDAKEALSDKGIIHELVHLMDLENEPLIDAKDIRIKWIKDCYISGEDLQKCRRNINVL